MFDHSSLVSFFNSLSDITIANLKLHFKKTQLQLKNLKTNQNTSAGYAYKVKKKRRKKPIKRK